MRQVVLDNRHVAALVTSPQFRILFPGVIPRNVPYVPCCGKPPEMYYDVKRLLLGMSNEQAVRVATAVGIPRNTQLVVRLVSKSRVDTRTFQI